MTQGLSILRTQKLTDDEAGNTREVATAFLKGLAGYIPHVGPILAEAIGVTIPSQKVERLYIFAQVFEDRLTYLEEDYLKMKM